MAVPVPLLPAGAKPRGDDFNKLRAQLESQRVTGSFGLLSSGFSGGSTLAALGLPPVIRRTGILRTFFVSGNGTADLTVSAGAINNVAYAGGTITAPADGDKVYIDATISGVTVTVVTVSAAASVPANTVTHVYKLLATVSVASSIATPTPVGWNFSEMQICAGSALWGGFGA